MTTIENQITDVYRKAVTRVQKRFTRKTQTEVKRHSAALDKEQARHKARIDALIADEDAEIVAVLNGAPPEALEALKSEGLISRQHADEAPVVTVTETDPVDVEAIR